MGNFGLHFPCILSNCMRLLLIKEWLCSVVISHKKCLDRGPDQRIAAFGHERSRWKKLPQAVTGRSDTGGMELTP